MKTKEELRAFERWVEDCYCQNLDPIREMKTKYGIDGKFVPGLLCHVPEEDMEKVIPVEGGHVIIQSDDYWSSWDAVYPGNKKIDTETTTASDASGHQSAKESVPSTGTVSDMSNNSNPDRNCYEKVLGNDWAKSVADYLNDETNDSDYLILAGPGTGKTTCLLYKIIRHIQNGGSPDDILFLTFTRYARESMVRRLKNEIEKNQELNGELKAVLGKCIQNIRTFNSFVGELHESLCADNQEMNLYTSTEEGQEDIFTRMAYEKSTGSPLLSKENENDFAIGEHRSHLENYDPFKTGGFMETSKIPKSKIKKFRELLGNNIQCIKEFSRSFSMPVDRDNPNVIKSAGNGFTAEDIIAIYNDYLERLSTHKRYDTTDMFHNVLTALRVENNYSKIREICPFKIILVDEMQDHTYTELAIVFALRNATKTEAATPRITMVGDLNQTLYFFKMASPAIFASNYFDGFKTLKLDMNYRSTKNIIDHVNAHLPISRRHDITNVLTKWHEHICPKPDIIIDPKKLSGSLEFEIRQPVTASKDENGELFPYFNAGEVSSKVKELIGKGIKDIAFLAFSKDDLRPRYKGITDNIKDSNVIPIFYPYLAPALQYTKFDLLQAFDPKRGEGGAGKMIERDDYEKELSRYLQDNLAKYELNFGMESDLTQSGEYQLLFKSFTKDVFDRKSAIPFRRLIMLNTREIGLKFLEEIKDGNKDKVYLTFINLHQIKGLEFDAVFYYYAQPHKNDKEEGLVGRLNLDYVARSRAKRFLYVVND